jgi:hypothetical protein
MVDWSASSVPKVGKDSIWIGQVVRAGEAVAIAEPQNPRTRSAATTRVRELLSSLAGRGVVSRFWWKIDLTLLPEEVRSNSTWLSQAAFF